MSKRKNVTVSAHTFSPYDFEGTLEDLLKEVKALIGTFGSKARLDYDRYHHEAYSSEASPQFQILVSREETEEEYHRRVGVEKSLDDDREARERADAQPGRMAGPPLGL